FVLLSLIFRDSLLFSPPRPPPISTLFPYTTLFRSPVHGMQTGRSVGHVLAELVASGDDLLPVGRAQIPRVAEEHFAEVVEVVADGLEQGRRFGLGAGDRKSVV